MTVTSAAVTAGQECLRIPMRSDDTCGPEIEIDLNLPPDLNFNLDLLYGFLQKDPAPALTFYGGEPLLRADLIERIVCEAPVQRFMMQTNGVLLDRLHPDIINRFSTILVSLDGRESLTDANRGTGTYRKVIENIKKIRHNGYRHRAHCPYDRKREFGHCRWSPLACRQPGFFLFIYTLATGCKFC